MRLDSLDRRIFALALPSLGALVAEPLFLLTDTAMVGHLGGDELASLGLAGTILNTLVGLMIFLAYATTPFVARRLGSGDTPGAFAAGVDGLWLALLLGVALGVAGGLSGPTIVSWFGADTGVAAGASEYLAISWWGVPGMLLVLAATGVLRGLQDTMTPLRVALVGFGANAALNALLIYGLGLGLPGSALGTVIAQWLMALWLVGIVVSRARPHQASLFPGQAGVLRAARLGGWLFVRTISLRVAFVGATVVATQLGTTELATWHVAFTVFTLGALALDSLEIAAQTLVGHRLGASDSAGTRHVVRRVTRWGIVAGVVIGLALAVLTPLLNVVVTSDAGVRSLLPLTLWTLTLALPIGGYVFVLDGVLMGAGDGRYLALTGIANLAALLPLFWLTLWAAQASSLSWIGIVTLQASVGFGYLGARALTLGLRARGTRWMVLGVDY